MGQNSTGEIVDGEVIVISKKTLQVLWKGRPYGISVEKILPDPASESFIILLDWEIAMVQGRKNLLKINTQGRVIWEVASPHEPTTVGIDRPPNDIYTDLNQVNNELIRAYAFSGFSDYIDIKSGNIIRSIFVK